MKTVGIINADFRTIELTDFRLLYGQRTRPKLIYQTEGISRFPRMAFCSWGRLIKAVKELRGAYWLGA